MSEAEELAALKKALAWVGQVHPGNSDYGSSRINIGDGHAIHMTWKEWNDLRAVLGLHPQKPFPKKRTKNGTELRKALTEARGWVQDDVDADPRRRGEDVLARIDAALKGKGEGK